MCRPVWGEPQERRRKSKKFINYVTTGTGWSQLRNLSSSENFPDRTSSFESTSKLLQFNVGLWIFNERSDAREMLRQEHQKNSNDKKRESEQMTWKIKNTKLKSAKNEWRVGHEKRLIWIFSDETVRRVQIFEKN